MLALDTTAEPEKVVDPEKAKEVARNITQKLHRIQKNIVELKQVWKLPCLVRNETIVLEFFALASLLWSVLQTHDTTHFYFFAGGPVNCPDVHLQWVRVSAKLARRGAD